MAEITIKSNRSFTDLDLNFNIHPTTKDINKFKNENAVINSVKNLVLTNHYERPFQPDLGSNLKRLLFEQVDNATAALLEREITETIENFEPRVQIKDVTASGFPDDNGYKVKKVDITENLRRYRQLPPASFNQKTYRMKKIKGNDLMLVVGKRLKKEMPDKKKVPKGSHRMPDGSIMKDKDMKGHKCKACAAKDKKGKYKK